MTTKNETAEAKIAKTRAASDPGLKAIGQIARALAPLPWATKTRVMNYVGSQISEEHPEPDFPIDD